MTAATVPAAGSKHTPGPWSWVNKGGWYALESVNGTRVADDGSACGEYNREIDPEDEGESGANARLIEAAPDQHDALCSAPVISKYHTAIGFDIEGFVRDYENWSEKKRAAIAKATGATP